MNHNQNNTQPNKQKEPNYRLRRTIAAGGLAVAGLLGAGNLLVKGDEKVTKHYDKIENEAIKNVESAWNATVVLREGATYRTAPKTVSPNEEGTPDTVAGIVPKGEVLVINNPVFYTETPNKGNFTAWLGFSVPSEKGDQNDLASTKNTYWVNFSELERQNSVDKAYVQVYNHGIDSERSSYMGKVIIDQENNFVVDLGNKGGTAGLASQMPETAFNHMLENSDLVLSHGK